MSKPLIKLYSMAYQDRSDRVRWLLEELKVPYENIFLQKSKGELKSQEYLKLNAMGRVPTLVDGSVVVHESAAICLYLSDKYRQYKVMSPELDSAERAEYLQWMVFSTASLECVVARMFTFNNKSAAEIEKIKQEVKEQCEILKIPLNNALKDKPYLLSSGYSAADIMMATIIPGAAEYLVDPGSPLELYMNKMLKNPIANKVFVFDPPPPH